MADRSGPDLPSPDLHLSITEDGEVNSKKKRMNELMESLRNRKGKIHTWNDTTKVLRMSMTDKRHQIENMEKHNISNHLSILQRSFKVSGFIAVLERLELLCSFLSLKFTKGHQNSDLLSVFISYEVFNVEVILDSKGIVKDVKIYHSSEPVHCSELVKLLNESNFEAFQAHLQGIMAIYNISGDKKQRMKAFTALQALETDLSNLSKLQSTINSVPNFIHKTPLGILVPRVGGTLMRMVYFVGPYDLLDKKSKTCKAMTIEGITDNNLGHSVTVCIEASNKSNKLQTMPLMTVNKTHEGKSLPRFTDFNNMNCSELNAVFVLKLHKKMSLSLSTIKAITSTTGIKFDEQLSIKPFWDVLVEATGRTPSDSVSVTLPDQNHCYYLGGPNGSSADQFGAIVEKIPFIHPTHVPTIIAYLRQQAVFNTVLSSCIRTSSQQDFGKFMTFEVLPTSMQSVNVTFEHPYTDAITTAEFDLSDITCLRCRLCNSQMDKEPTKSVEICADEYASKIFQRCLSLPVTLRSVFSEAYHKMELHIIPPPKSPPPVKKTAGKQCISSILPFQLNYYYGNKVSSVVPMSRKGQERRAAFLEAYRDNKMHSLTSAVSTLSSNGGSLLSSFSSQPGIANTTTSQHHTSASISVMNNKTVTSGMVHTPNRENGSNTRDAAVVSPEVVQAYETGFADPSQAPKEVIDAIKKDKISKNPMLASLLDQERDSPEPVPASSSSMLISLLGDQNNPTHPTQNNVSNSTNNVNPTAVPGKQPNYNYQQQTQNQKKVRKRKIMPSGESNSNSNPYGQLPINNTNTGLIGRSPKRLHSEEDSLQPFSFSSISSAENDTSQHAQYHPHHAMGNNHPLVGVSGMLSSNNSLDMLPPGISQPQNANFHSQTRGANPLLPVVSSSVVMVTESNITPPVSSNSSLQSFPTQQSPLSTTVTNNSQANPTNMLISPSSAAGSTSHFKEESPVFKLASTIDSIMIKQETKPIVNFGDPLAMGTSDCNSINSGNVSKKVSDFLHSKDSSVKNCSSPDTLRKSEITKNCNISEKYVTGRTTSIEDSSKKESPMSLELICESIPNPVKERTVLGLKGGASHSSLDNYSRPKSRAEDPYEFKDNFLDQSGSMDSIGTDQSEISLDSYDKPALSGNVGNSGMSKIITSKYSPKEKYEYEVVKPENFVNPKKERKKSSRENKEYLVENRKPMLGITVKINAKEGSAKAYVKQSPLHRSESPHDIDISSRRIKESRIKHGSITPDHASDISTDSDVFVVGTESATFNKSGSTSNSVSPRILTSKKLGSDRSGSYNASGVTHKEKKKKSSKTLSGESKHEKKRKRHEEAMKKDQLKKQKVYDFDFNESEHLPPTKIKIRTSSDGKVQIQTGSMKPYSMSPLPMKVDSELRSSPLTTSSMKRHKSDKSLKHKKDKSEKYNRSKSEPQGAKLDKSDSKLYGRTPVVKIKPLENSSCQSVSITSTSSTVTSKTSGSGNVQIAPIVKVTMSPLVTSSSMTITVPKSSSKVANSVVSSKSSSENSSKNKLSLSSENSSKTVKHNIAAETSSKSSKTGTDSKMNKQAAVTESNSSKSNKQVASSENSSKSSKLVTMSESASLKMNKSTVVDSNSLKTNKQILSSESGSKNKMNNDSSAKVKITSSEKSKSSSGNDNGSKSKPIIINSENSSKNKQVLNAENSAKNSKHVIISDLKTSKPSNNSSKSSNVVITSVESSNNKPKNYLESERRRQSSSGASSLTNSVDSSVKNKLTVPVTVSGNSTSSSNNESAITKSRLSADKGSSSSIHNSGDKHKNKSNLGSNINTEKELTNKTKHDKNEKVTSLESQSSKVKSEKSTSGDIQKKQRKGSLSAVIDKLKKGFNETESEPKKAQDMYDEIRHAILKAGATKSSTPPIGKIGKISKQDTVSNTSQNSNKAVPVNMNKSITVNKASSSSVLDGILSKPSTTGSFRIPKSTSINNSSSGKTDTDTKTKENSNTATSSVSTVNSIVKTSSHSTLPNHTAQKGPSNHVNTVRQNSRESYDKNLKKPKIDDISEKLQSRHFLDAVGSISPKEGSSDSGVPDKKNSSQTGNKLDTKHQNSDNKLGNTRPDIQPSSKGEHKNWNSHYTGNSDQTRSKSPVVNTSLKSSSKPINKIGHSTNVNNYRNNQIHSSSSQQKVQQNRPRTPVESTSNKQLHPVNNIIDQPKSISSRDPRAGGGQGYSDLPSSKASVKDTSSNSTLSSTSVSASSTNILTSDGNDPSHKPTTFYNPAEALGRKPSSSSESSKIMSSSSSSSYMPGKKEKKPPLPSGKAPIIIPLVNTSVSESPASPVDKPGLTIRHETPPASPVMGGVDVSDNKENMAAAKSIPLEDGKVFKAPTPKSTLRTEDSIKCSKIIASCSTSDKPCDGNKQGDAIVHSKPISSPSSEISSPEESLGIESAVSATASNGKAPVTIPLERSRSRSPAERSRSPLTPRSPIQGHIPRSKSPSERSRSPLTPRSPAPIQSPSPKDTSVKSPINKFHHKPSSPCKTVKSPLTQLASPVSRPSPRNSIDEDDLMNEALMM